VSKKTIFFYLFCKKIIFLAFYFWSEQKIIYTIAYTFQPWGVPVNVVWCVPQPLASHTKGWRECPGADPAHWL
jgi:hypothetical protein